MKNRLSWGALASLVCLLFASCEEEGKDSPFGQLEGTYSNSNLKTSLSLKYSGEELLGKSAEWKMEKDGQATLTLNGILPGEKQSLFPGIAVTPVEGGCSFAVEHRTDARSVAIDGAIREGGMSLEVVAEYVNDLVGEAWQPDAKNPVVVEWETVGGKAYDLVQLKNKEGKPTGLKITTKTLSTLAGPMLKGLVLESLKDASFLKDGNFTVTYNAAKEETAQEGEPQGTWTALPLNHIHYCVQEGACTLYPQVEMLARLMGLENSEALFMVQAFLENGIPCRFSLEARETGTALQFYLDEAFFKGLLPVLKMAGGLMQEDSLVEVTTGMYISTKELLTNLPVALENTERMKTGINFLR